MGPSEFKQSNGEREIKFECELHHGLNDPWVSNTEKGLADLRFALKEIKVDRTSDNPYTYTYKLSDWSGRAWNQTFQFINGLDKEPQMNFDTDFWKLSEFESHRFFRSLVIEGIQRFRLVSLKINYAEP